MPKFYDYEENLNKIGKENWKELSDRSDTPSDTQRESIYTRYVEDSSDKRIEAEKNHKERVLQKLQYQTTAIEKAKEETRDRNDKSQLRVFISTISRCGIPFGAVVKLLSLTFSKDKCTVLYENQQYTIKKEYIKKIWE